MLFSQGRWSLPSPCQGQHCRHFAALCAWQHWLTPSSTGRCMPQSCGRTLCGLSVTCRARTGWNGVGRLVTGVLAGCLPQDAPVLHQAIGHLHSHTSGAVCTKFMLFKHYFLCHRKILYKLISVYIKGSFFICLIHHRIINIVKKYTLKSL